MHYIPNRVGTSDVRYFYSNPDLLYQENYKTCFHINSNKRVYFLTYRRISRSPYWHNGHDGSWYFVNFNGCVTFIFLYTFQFLPCFHFSSKFIATQFLQFVKVSVVSHWRNLQKSSGTKSMKIFTSNKKISLLRRNLWNDPKHFVIAYRQITCLNVKGCFPVS